MSNYIIKNDELQHHGVKGMKWGVRRAQKKYVEKAQRQYDANMNSAKYLKKILDDDYDPITESRLTKGSRKAHVSEYNSIIDSGKKWLSTKADIMNMNLYEVSAKDIKRRFNNSGGIYYPFA